MKWTCTKRIRDVFLQSLSVTVQEPGTLQCTQKPRTDKGVSQYSLASVILVDSEGSVDASTVDSLALLVKAAHRGAHTLGSDEHNVDVRTELLADALLFETHANRQEVQVAKSRPCDRTASFDSGSMQACSCALDLCAKPSTHRSVAT